MRDNTTKLTIEHLSPYLPYNLKVAFIADEYTHELVGLEIGNEGVLIISPFEDSGRAYYEDVRPILKPLSDLTENKDFYNKFLEDFGDNNEGLDYLRRYKTDITFMSITYDCVMFLTKNHFDIFGLIDKKLAKNKNVL